MTFDPESIERLSPAARVEVQDYYAKKYLADRVRYLPERRANRPPGSASSPEPAQSPVATSPVGRPRWPRAVWFRNDSSRASTTEPPRRR